MVKNRNTGIRWVYLAVAAIVMIFLGLIYAWSIFKAPLHGLFPTWTAADLSLVFTLSMVCFCVGCFLGGLLQAKGNPTLIMLVCAVLMAAGMLLVSWLRTEQQAGSLYQLFIGYSLLCGGSVGVAYNTILSCLMKWFPEKGGFVSGSLLMGFGFGSLILGVVANALIDSLGVLSTFRILAAAAFAVVGAGAFFIKRPEGGQTAAFSGAHTDGSVRNYTPREMLRTATFWLFFCWNIVVVSAGLLVINSAATIAAAFGAPAIMGLLISVFNGGGRLLIGTIFDRFGQNKTMAFNSALLLLAGGILVLAARGQAVVWIIIGMLMVGVSYGGGPCMGSAVINRAFGPKYYSVNFSLNTFNMIPGAFIGPMFSSKLLEASNGTYDSTFLMIVVLAVFALLLSLLLSLAQRRRAAVSGS